MDKPKTFETERLLLRPTSTEDAAFILELVNSPKWLEFIGDRNVRNIDDAVKYIESRITPQFERLGYANYTVIRKSDHVKLGSCGLYDREGLEDIDIGFAFLPEYEKRGYAFESANKLKEIAVSEFGIKELCAITVEENISSQNLLKKLGFEYSGKRKVTEKGEELMVFELTQ
ncbi:MAG: GNAT family N-acetyltransferase [Bacteroidota bacterium]